MSEDVELFVVISSSAFGLGIALAFACLFVWLRAAFSVSGVGELYRALTLGGAGAFAYGVEDNGDLLVKLVGNVGSVTLRL